IELVFSDSLYLLDLLYSDSMESNHSDVSYNVYSDSYSSTYCQTFPDGDDDDRIYVSSCIELVFSDSLYLLDLLYSDSMESNHSDVSYNVYSDSYSSTYCQTFPDGDDDDRIYVSSCLHCRNSELDSVVDYSNQGFLD
nr:hypothetical protein [Tanacetum cinerariifolium]